MHKYIISGHLYLDDQNNPDEPVFSRFELPYYVTLCFNSNEGYTCYATYEKDTLDMIVNDTCAETIQRKNISETINVNDYKIIFPEGPSAYEGIAKVEYEGGDELNRKYTYTFLDMNYGNEAVYTLSYMINLLLKKHNRQPIYIYCAFCRGTKRESFADFTEFTGLNKETDFDLDTLAILGSLTDDKEDTNIMSNAISNTISNKTLTTTRSKRYNSRRNKRKVAKKSRKSRKYKNYGNKYNRKTRKTHKSYA